MQDIQMDQTDQEMTQSSRSVSPPELENFQPPRSSPGTESPPIDNRDREPRSPSPESDRFDGGEPPVPPSTPPADNLDDIDPPIDDLDGDINPPPDSDGEDPPLSDSDEEEPPGTDSDENDPSVTRDDMKTTLEFIRMLETATLDTQFSPDELEAFQNPQEISSLPSDDPDLLLSISNYVTNLNASQKIYIQNHLNLL